MRARLSVAVALLSLAGCAGSVGGGPTGLDGGSQEGADGAAAGDDGDPGRPSDGADGTAGDGADGADPNDGGSEGPADDGGATPTSDAGTPDGAPGPLSECPNQKSIDRFESWLASGEGTTRPATGSILEGEGDDVVGRIEFVNAEWHVVPVLVQNQFDAQADFSAARGFWLTYSATDDLWVQLRPGFAWDGGDKYLTAIPSTGGVRETRFFSFDASAWTTLDALGMPSYPYAMARAAVRGFVFVGDTPNILEFAGLRVDGYEPPCL